MDENEPGEDVLYWLSRQDVMNKLGISERQVNRLAAKEKIRKAYRPRPSARPQDVYHPDDVQKLQKERSAKTAHVIPYSSRNEALQYNLEELKALKARFDAMEIRVAAAFIQKQLRAKLEIAELLEKLLE